MLNIQPQFTSGEERSVLYIFKSFVISTWGKSGNIVLRYSLYMLSLSCKLFIHGICNEGNGSFEIKLLLLFLPDIYGVMAQLVICYTEKHAHEVLQSPASLSHIGPVIFITQWAHETIKFQPYIEPFIFLEKQNVKDDAKVVIIYLPY